MAFKGSKNKKQVEDTQKIPTPIEDPKNNDPKNEDPKPENPIPEENPAKGSSQPEGSGTPKDQDDPKGKNDPGNAGGKKSDKPSKSDKSDKSDKKETKPMSNPNPNPNPQPNQKPSANQATTQTKPASTVKVDVYSQWQEATERAADLEKVRSIKGKWSDANLITLMELSHKYLSVYQVQSIVQSFAEHHAEDVIARLIGIVPQVLDVNIIREGVRLELEKTLNK